MKPDFRAFLIGESCALSKDFFLKFKSLSIKHYNSTLRTRSIILWDLQSYVNFNQSFVRGMLFHQSDWSKIYSIKMYVKYHSPSSCEILNKSIETFLGYSEKSWFYVDFNHFSGEVCSSTKAIDLFFYKKCMNHNIAPLCEISNKLIENFLRYKEISWVYVDFSLSFGRGMLFY